MVYKFFRQKIRIEGKRRASSRITQTVIKKFKARTIYVRFKDII